MHGVSNRVTRIRSIIYGERSNLHVVVVDYVRKRYGWCYLRSYGRRYQPQRRELGYKEY